MPDFSEGYKERGRIKLMLNDKAGATDDLKKALETSPEAAKAVEGQFSNIEQEMNGQYKTVTLTVSNVIKIRYSFTFFPFKRKKAAKTFCRK